MNTQNTIPKHRHNFLRETGFVAPLSEFMLNSEKIFAAYIDNNTDRYKTALVLGRDEKEVKERMNFIVTACNLHNELIEALKEVVTNYQNISERFCDEIKDTFNLRDYPSIERAKKLLVKSNFLTLLNKADYKIKK